MCVHMPQFARQLCNRKMRVDGDKEAGQVTDKIVVNNGLITKTFEDNGIVIHLEEALSKIEGFGSQEQSYQVILQVFN